MVLAKVPRIGGVEGGDVTWPEARNGKVILWRYYLTLDERRRAEDVNEYQSRSECLRGGKGNRHEPGGTVEEVRSRTP